MKHIFIINRNSGKLSKNQDIRQQIETKFAILREEVLIFDTFSVAETKEIARKMTFQYPGSILYSVGGDGTLNAIINSADLSNTTITIVPYGSGNDTYKSFVGNEEDFDLLQTILNTTSEVTVHDLMNVNKMKAINVISTGVGAKAADNFRKLRWLPLSSNAKYKLGALGAIMKNDFETVQITSSNYAPFDENGIVIPSNSVKTGMEGKIAELVICNGKYYGSRYCISPYSDTSDGYLSIIEASHMNLFHLLKLFEGINEKKHLHDDLISYYNATSINVRSVDEEDLTIQVDGEIFYNSKLDVSIAPKALRLKRQKYQNVVR